MLFAGKLVPFKRPLDLVAAASQLKSQGANISVLVAGSGPLQSEIIAAARTTGVSCHMLGFCNQSEMPAVYAAADVLVLPSDGARNLGARCQRGVGLRPSRSSSPTPSVAHRISQ